nr:hypothetical protein [Lupinus angustifolius]
MVFICDYESDSDVEILPGPPPCFQKLPPSSYALVEVLEPLNAVPPSSSGGGGGGFFWNGVDAFLASLRAKCGFSSSDSESESESDDSCDGRFMTMRTYKSKASQLSVPAELSGEDSRYWWVDREVLGTPSTFLYGSSLSLPVGKESFHGFEAVAPRTVERVCYDFAEEKKDKYTFFMYEAYVRRLGLRLPLEEWDIQVLAHLQLAPSQLTPNSWGFIRAFEIMCRAAGFPCTLNLFFWMFRVGHRTNSDKENEGRHGWTSLISRPRRGLLTPFSSNEKKWKGGYFKISVRRAWNDWCLSKSGEPRFPFAWNGEIHQRPAKGFLVEVGDLNPEEAKAAETISFWIDEGGILPCSAIRDGGGALADLVVALKTKMSEKLRKSLLLKRAGGAALAKMDAASSKRQKTSSFSPCPTEGSSRQEATPPSSESGGPPPTEVEKELSQEAPETPAVASPEAVPSAETAGVPPPASTGDEAGFSVPPSSDQPAGEVGGRSSEPTRKGGVRGAQDRISQVHVPRAIEQALLNANAKEAFDKVPLSVLLRNAKGSAVFIASIQKYLEADGVLEARVAEEAASKLRAAHELEKQRLVEAHAAEKADLIKLGEAVKAQVADLSARVGFLESDKIKLTAQVMESEGAVRAREDALRRREEEVGAWKARAGVAMRENAALLGQVQALTEEKASREARVRALEGEKEQLEEAVGEAAADAWVSAQSQCSLSEHKSTDNDESDVDEEVGSGRQGD